MAPVRSDSPAFRCVLAASFASAMVALLGVQTFIVYLWGRSRSGKTPTLKAAGSVWGDPTEGSDSYFRTFADTPKSIVRAAALFHDIPVIIDELQSKGAPGGQASKRQIVEDLLYSLSLGHERGALNSDRSMMRRGRGARSRSPRARSPSSATQRSRARPTAPLELNAEPFSDVRAAQEMHRLVVRQHGTAGRAFVGALRRNPAEFYERQFAQVRDAVGSIACGHPQADNIALLAFADALAEYYVFAPGTGWQACLDGALSMALWAFGNATGAEGGDTDLKAIQFLAEWLVGNKIHFDDYCENDRLERWGAIEEKGCAAGFYWFRVLERAGAGAFLRNFDRAKTLRPHGRGGASGVRFGAPVHEAEALPQRGAGLLRLHRQRGAGGVSGAHGGSCRRHRGSRRRAMLRRGLRRPYRLVRVRIHGARLNVFTGRRNEAATRAGARARTGARGVGAGLVETLRRLAFRLAAGRFPVSPKRCDGDGGGRAGMRRGGRGPR